MAGDRVRALGAIDALGPDGAVGPDMEFLWFANCARVNHFYSATQSLVGAALVAHLGGEFLFPGQVAHDP